VAVTHTPPLWFRLSVCVNRFKRLQISINEIIKMRLRLCGWLFWGGFKGCRGTHGVSWGAGSRLLHFARFSETDTACKLPGSWLLSIWILVFVLVYPPLQRCHCCRRFVSRLDGQNWNLHNYCSIFWLWCPSVLPNLPTNSFPSAQPFLICSLRLVWWGS